MKVEVPDYEIAERLEVEPERSVLLVVDMQNDFAHPDGALYNPDAEDSIPVIRRLADRARAADVPVWYTQDTHREDDPEWEIWGRHVEEGTFGWEIVEELEPREDDRVFRKSRYDGFYETGLDHALRVEGRGLLVVCGTVANICVHYTAASAGLRWYDVVHPVEGLSALTEFDLHASLRQASWLFQARLVRADGLSFPA
jgi:nicotinamidase-related amidase